MLKQACSNCETIFEDLSLLYFYKSKCLCINCYKIDKDSMTVLDIVKLYEKQRSKILDNTLMLNGIASDKQLNFIRFIHMYSSSKKLPDTNCNNSIQEFINKYKNEAFALSDRLKKICLLNSKNFPILAAIETENLNSIHEAQHFVRKMFVNWLDRDERDLIEDDYNYDATVDKINFLGH